MARSSAQLIGRGGQLCGQRPRALWVQQQTQLELGDRMQDQRGDAEIHGREDRARTEPAGADRGSEATKWIRVLPGSGAEVVLSVAPAGASVAGKLGAGEGNRTLDTKLGKLLLYH